MFSRFCSDLTIENKGFRLAHIKTLEGAFKRDSRMGWQRSLKTKSSASCDLKGISGDMFETKTPLLRGLRFPQGPD